MSGLEELSREELIALTRALMAENAALKAEVTQLRERVAKLERLVSRNSGNSGMPPSVDDLPGRKQPKDRASGGGRRRPGKQPGAEGKALAWSDDVADDDVFEYFPQGWCGCGADLAQAADLGVTARHQQIEIPLVVARRLQHNLHAVACRCGAVHTAPRPDGVSATPVSCGVNLQAWCVYLLVVHAIPVHRCAELVASLTGAQPSPGFVHGLIGRAAAAVAAANARIRTLLTLAYVVCCDETPIRVGPKKAKKYLLVACNQLLTWYMLGGRDLDTFKRFMPAEATGVVVHDRYQNYDAADLGIHDHQLCVAHLIRDLEDCAETYPGARWPRQLQMALRGLIHAANLAREQGRDAIAAGTLAMFTTMFRGGVAVGLSEVRRVPGPAKTVTQPVGRVLLEVLRDRADDVLRFAHDLRIPPTNNQAERDLRPAKTQQKISGRLRSEQHTRHRYAVRGYLSTAIKHGLDVMTVLRDALVGRLWMPPDPATA
ncbi:IS66 family transposase [Microbispora sp. H10670]|uniref:IS66 family transposase n=1 Tax=Microbispora sp. H10670 TaxID=2729108 RepID=UPI0015FEFA09|nr:IS66 family transposase [Microbispora sp. H10670]